MFLNLQSSVMPFVRRSLFHSHLFCPFLLMESMCLCLQRQGQKKELAVGKKKRENREEFAFTASLFKSSPPPFSLAESECERKKKDRKNRKRIWGIRGPDWVSNTYSGEQSVLTLFPSRPG